MAIAWRGEGPRSSSMGRGRRLLGCSALPLSLSLSQTTAPCSNQLQGAGASLVLVWTARCVAGYIRCDTTTLLLLLLECWYVQVHPHPAASLLLCFWPPHH